LSEDQYSVGTTELVY